jgi:MerR family transcriptional regulator, light-induced transcriptional regulator
LTIRDLERLSGVKAHTIRVWERRYGLLHPERTDTNLRRYSVDELKTVLNAAFLSRHGMRISRIAAASRSDRERWVREKGLTGGGGSAMDTLKVAMLTYDTAVFQRISRTYEQQRGFRSLMEDLYLPFLEHIGLLWQTSAVCPAHEHFASNLVRQRLITAIDGAGDIPFGKGRTYVLFLPEHEIHELGLLYVQYLLTRAGHRVLYLGASVPLPDLFHVRDRLPGDLVFVGICTCAPAPEFQQAYVDAMADLADAPRVEVHLAGALFEGSQGKEPSGLNLVQGLRPLVRDLSLA